MICFPLSLLFLSCLFRTASRRRPGTGYVKQLKDNLWDGRYSPVCGKIVVKRKITANLAVIFLEMVDLKGLEPSTSRLRTWRSPS